MHLHQVLGWDGPMTARQYRAWQRFLLDDYNRPSRSDHYAMQVAAEVFRTIAKEPQQVRREQFGIYFPDVGANQPALSSQGNDGEGYFDPPVVTDETLEVMRKKTSMAGVVRPGVKVEHRVVDKDGNLIEVRNGSG